MCLGDVSFVGVYIAAPRVFGFVFCFFFFQAEDGIRDLTVTGVQTGALPISFAVRRMSRSWNENWSLRRVPRPDRDGGVKKPSRAKPRTCATVNPSSLATSREVYPFIPYWLLAPGTSHFAFGDGSRFRRLALDPLRRFPLASRPFRLEARLERCHQVDDLRLRRLCRLLGHLLAIDLALNLLEHPFADF